MAEKAFKRKLAALLSADVVGYSLLMDQDEEGTIRNLKAFRRAMTDYTLQYRGRVVDSPGDNVLAEFTSVVDAVNCAVEVQRDFAERNAELPEERRMQFRIGVNLGDVVDDNGRIYGDGINIAARVESMAEAGGICITGRAYDQVANKLGLEYDFLGEHQVKNISIPIRVYRVLSYPGAAAHRVAMAKKVVGNKRRRLAFAAGGIAAVAVLSILGLQNYFGSQKPVEAASVEKMKHPLPDKPSIAVLPFSNLSGQADDEYIADGITDDIITAISKVDAMFVIARNSVFTYKNKPVKIKDVSEEFGVEYVLEGSVDRSEDRLRVTAKLIDTLSGHHMWVERFERQLEDIFDLKDDITQRVLAELAVQLTDGEKMRLFSNQRKTWKRSSNLTKVFGILPNGKKRENAQKAQEHFMKAVELDPGFVGAIGFLANTHYLGWLMYWSPNRADSFRTYVNLTQKAISLNPSSSYAYFLQGQLYRHQGHYVKAITECNAALQLDPNNSNILFFQGRNFHLAGQSEKAIEFIKDAMRLDPFFVDTNLVHLGQSLHAAGRYQEALDSYGKYAERQIKANEKIPEWVYYCFIIAHLELGQIENAYKYFEKATTTGRQFRYTGWAIQWMGYKKSDKERLLKLFEPLHKMTAEAEMAAKK